jgi:hypothetical protein
LGAAQDTTPEGLYPLDDTRATRTGSEGSECRFLPVASHRPKCLKTGPTRRSAPATGSRHSPRGSAWLWTGLLIPSVFENFVTLWSNRRNSQTMKQASNPTILVFAFFVAVQFGASATTCVATKTFKVKEVCGKLTNPLNEPIARAEVDLLHDGPDVSSGVLTDDGGEFHNAKRPRCSTAHHGDVRVVPRANRTFSSARSPIPCATSSRDGLPVYEPWPP